MAGLLGKCPSEDRGLSEINGFSRNESKAYEENRGKNRASPNPSSCCQARHDKKTQYSKPKQGALRVDVVLAGVFLVAGVVVIEALIVLEASDLLLIKRNEEHLRIGIEPKGGKSYMKLIRGHQRQENEEKNEVEFCKHRIFPLIESGLTSTSQRFLKRNLKK